ncbi:MAG: hypothetical protein RDV41_00605 [Planctomycetota bacterium]|nr:hypothetical protein [Planctomycetota bacterium]
MRKWVGSRTVVFVATAFALLFAASAPTQSVGPVVNPQGSFAQAVKEADQKIVAYQNALKAGNQTAIHESAMAIRRDTFAANRLNRSGTQEEIGKFQARMNDIENKTLAKAKMDIEQMPEFQGKQVKWQTASNAGKKGFYKASQDFDYTLTVLDEKTGKWAPVGEPAKLRKVESAVNDNYYKYANPASPKPTRWEAAEFAKNHSITQCDPHHPEYYAGGSKIFENQKRGLAPLAGLDTRQVEDVTHAIRYKSNHEIMAARKQLEKVDYVIAKRGLEGTTEARALRELAQKQLVKAEVEGARQFVKQWDATIKPTILAAKGTIPGELQDEVALMRKLATGKMSPADAKTALGRLSRNLDNVVDETVDLTRKAAALLQKNGLSVTDRLLATGPKLAVGLAMVGQVYGTGDMSERGLQDMEKSLWKGEEYGFKQSLQTAAQYGKETLSSLGNLVFKIPAELAVGAWNKTGEGLLKADDVFQEQSKDNPWYKAFGKTALVLGGEMIEKGKGAVAGATGLASKAWEKGFCGVMDETGQLLKVDKIFSLWEAGGYKGNIQTAAAFLPEVKLRVEKKLGADLLSLDIIKAKMEKLVEEYKGSDPTKDKEFLQKEEQLTKAYEKLVAGMNRKATATERMHAGLEKFERHRISPELQSLFERIRQIPPSLKPAGETSAAAAKEKPEERLLAQARQLGIPEEKLQGRTAKELAALIEEWKKVTLNVTIELSQPRVRVGQRLSATVRIEGGTPPYTVTGKGASVETDGELSFQVKVPNEPGTYEISAEAVDQEGKRGAAKVSYGVLQGREVGGDVYLVGPETMSVGETGKFTVTTVGAPPFTVTVVRRSLSQEGEEATDEAVAEFTMTGRVGAFNYAPREAGREELYATVVNSDGNIVGRRLWTMTVKP